MVVLHLVVPLRYVFPLDRHFCSYSWRVRSLPEHMWEHYCAVNYVKLVPSSLLPCSLQSSPPSRSPFTSSSLHPLFPSTPPFLPSPLLPSPFPFPLHLLLPPFIPSSLHSLLPPFTLSFLPSLSPPSLHSLTLSSLHSLTLSSLHSLTLSSLPSLPHSLLPPFTPSLSSSLTLSSDIQQRNIIREIKKGAYKILLQYNYDVLLPWQH